MPDYTKLMYEAAERLYEAFAITPQAVADAVRQKLG